jgi:hypothetical protein
MLARSYLKATLLKNNPPPVYHLTDVPSMDEVSRILDEIQDGEVLIIDCDGYPTPGGARIDALALHLCECEFSSCGYEYSLKEKKLFFWGVAKGHE